MSAMVTEAQAVTLKLQNRGVGMMPVNGGTLLSCSSLSCRKAGPYLNQLQCAHDTVQRQVVPGR